MTYPKVPSPFKRFTEGPDRNKFDPTEWTSEELRLLADVHGWTFTEKLDGTNIRIIWDGYKPEFRGRTDKADIPKDLLQFLGDQFTEELLEQTFGAQPVILYGEGIGPKINGGGKYSLTPSFVLFDVRIDKWWLQYNDILGISDSLGVQYAPRIMQLTLWHAINDVTAGLKSEFGDFNAEGVVGVAPMGLLSRSGDRIQVKVKTVDFFEAGYDFEEAP